MIKLKNPTLQKFILQLIDAIKEENRDAIGYVEPKQLDIPFVISSLYQSFKDYPKKFTEFIKDLEDYPDYEIVIEIPQIYDTVATATVFFVECYPLHEDGDNILDFRYVINFELDDRPWGYCECTPDMPDYREDKHCCGHGCDATFCRFTLTKTYDVTFGSWNGDEHDYWDFEDEFYMSESELKAKKEREEREKEIRRLKDEIEKNTERLNTLMKESELK